MGNEEVKTMNSTSLLEKKQERNRAISEGRDKAEEKMLLKETLQYLNDDVQSVRKRDEITEENRQGDRDLQSSKH